MSRDEHSDAVEEWQHEPTNPAVSFTREIEVPDQAALVILVGEPQGRSYPIIGEMVIGRGPAATIRLGGSDISREHTRVYRGPSDELLVEDLGSQNGTLLDGTPLLEARQLHYGSRLQLGASTVLVFSHHSPLEEQVLEQQKLEAIGRLAGGIAHEYNNLLAVIRSNVTLLLEQIPSGAIPRHEIIDCLRDVDQAADDAANLTAQLVSFSQRGRHAEQRFDLAPVIRNAVRLLADATLRRVKIDVDISGPMIVVGDRVQLQQVVMALGLNACDAMGGNGRLTIGGRRLETPPADAHTGLVRPVVQLTVSDDGPGMDAEACSQIFEPFFSSRALGRGGGLGLATVYGIVRAHGGQILADSALGVGSSFRIYLPAADLDLTEEAPSVTEQATPTVGGSVLIIDDDPLVLKGSARVVQRLGFNPLCARSGKEGIELFLQHRTKVRLVLLDLVMPEMDGEQTFNLLRQIAPNVGVLLVSGYGSDDMITRLLTGGASGLVKKPFSIGTMKDAIARAIAGERDILV